VSLKKPHWRNTPEEYDRRWLALVMARTVPNEIGCALWQGTVNYKGYGSKGYRGKTWNVHRMVYILTHGASLTTEQFVCHSCDNRRCINPDHLWIGTALDNSRDSYLKERHWVHLKTQCPKGHPYTEPSVFRETRKGRNCPICQRARHRIAAGWPEDLAYSTPPRGRAASCATD
jgi:hypothetical protein